MNDLASEKEHITVFIGSGEASLLERKVLIHSLRKNSNRELDIYVFNGTHNSIERNDDKPYLASMPLEIKYKNVTEFSLYRFLIPEIREYKGKAIFLDSDTVCLDDIGKLFDSDLNGFDFLAKRNAYSARDSDLWGLSVALIDCAKCKFDLPAYFKEISEGKYSYSDFSNMSPSFLKHHPFNIGELDDNWNVFDRYNKDTKLIHYTNLYTQPWKFKHHLYGDLWFKYFHEAINKKYITQQDITLSKERSYVRKNIMKGNSLVSKMHFLRPIFLMLKKLYRTTS
jgi:lipopolysaccharide biosynthesis glycosyltransferase